MFSSLVGTGDDLKPSADAAESWKVTGLEYSFLLKQGLKFSNGRDVNKADLEFSFKEALLPTSPFASYFRNVGKIEVKEADSRLLVTIKLSIPSASFLTDLAVIKILPAQEIAASPAEFEAKPMGTGPYQMVSSDTNSVSLTANQYAFE
ncbi:MAG: ABC transporter substrate-binding protein, partial [Bdellovibrionota bacterium]